MGLPLMFGNGFSVSGPTEFRYSEQQEAFLPFRWLRRSQIQPYPNHKKTLMIPFFSEFSLF